MTQHLRWVLREAHRPTETVPIFLLADPGPDWWGLQLCYRKPSEYYVAFTKEWVHAGAGYDSSTGQLVITQGGTVLEEYVRKGLSAPGLPELYCAVLGAIQERLQNLEYVCCLKPWDINHRFWREPKIDHIRPAPEPSPVLMPRPDQLSPPQPWPHRPPASPHCARRTPQLSPQRDEGYIEATTVPP